jgi:hypothetical protein
MHAARLADAEGGLEQIDERLWRQLAFVAQPPQPGPLAVAQAAIE